MLTGKENLIMIAKLRGVSNPNEVADNLLARFSLTDAANRRADQYSGGMKRRLDIAMSLIGAPAVIFLDEPTTGLDPEARIEVWNTVKELAGGGTTILLTTQYLEEAEQLADRIAILHGGKIIKTGTQKGGNVNEKQYRCITRTFDAKYYAQPGYNYYGGDYADYDDATVCLRIWGCHKYRNSQLRQLFITRNLADGYRIRRRLHFRAAI